MVKFTTFTFTLLLLPLTALTSPAPAGAEIDKNGEPVYKDSQEIQWPRTEFAKQNLWCETSKASPRTDDIFEAAKQVNEWSSKVWQTNKFGSKCSQLTHYMTAKVSVCNGGKKAWMRSDNARRFAEWIAYQCKKDGRAGGYYEHWDLGMRIVVH